MVTLVLLESIGRHPNEGDLERKVVVRRPLWSLVYGLCCLLMALLTAGCSSDSGPDAQQPVVLPPPPPPPVVTSSPHGHYRGVAAIGSEMFHSELVLTADGEYRIYVGGPVNGGSGLLGGGGVTDDLLQPASSTQIFGQLGTGGSEQLGDGIAVGQICPAGTSERFCGQNSVVEFEITSWEGRHVTGEIRVPTPAGDEIWSLDVTRWSLYYNSRAALFEVAGSYVEVLAPFAKDEDVIVTIGSAGTLFFQDPGSGCTGNGTLTPHNTGRYYVFDVALSIGNCSADYDYLNSDNYVGLATATQNGYWSYDFWLLLIVADTDSQSPAAITMYAGHVW